MQTTTDTAIYGWHIESTDLTDGSKVFNVIGASDEARIVINCEDEAAANTVWSALTNRCSGASAERL